MPVEIRSRLQEEVESTIRELGGYWPPLVAVARLLEELGEVGEIVTSWTDSKEDMLRDELADLVIITTCLANQYCANLDHEYRSLSLGLIPRPARPMDIERHLARICTAAGPIARIINFYEGDKPLRDTTSAGRLGPLVAQIHREIYSFSGSLQEAVSEKLRHSRERDRKRFLQKFDPSVAPSLVRFRKVQMQTQCVFAPIARLWGSPDWAQSEDLETNLGRLIPLFTRFARIAPHELLDGFVLEFSGDTFGNSVHALGRTVNRTLRYLGAHDPSGSDCMQQAIDHPEWQFTFNGTRCFLISFAPCYPPSSSRYSFGAENTYLFFQPERSFQQLKIQRGEDKQVRHTIREAYRQHGRPYDIEIMGTPLEAPRYVKPAKVGDPVVRWWEFD